MKDLRKKLRIFFYSIEATGHLNATIGIAQALQNRGHEVLFFISPNTAQSVAKFNIPIYELKSSISPEEDAKNTAKMIAEVFIKSGGISGKPSIEKLFMWTDLSENSILRKIQNCCYEFNDQIEAEIIKNKPDCFILDHSYFQPFIGKYNIPWISILSTDPIFLYDGPNHPPALSGYSAEDRDKFDEFNEKLKESSRSYNTCQVELNKHFGYVPKADEYNRRMYYVISPYLNLYQYPKELDYDECEPLFPNIVGVDAFIRISDEKFLLPERIQPNRDAGEKLIFLSMGSMGGIDLTMMRKLIGSLSRIKHKVIVSKGVLGDELELADNMWGENFLPQTKILPLVDLVITHGGNNSVTESFFFGKPMIVLPLFCDQYDNAQRVQEKGYGIRLEPYSYQESELHLAIETLLSDDILKERLKKASIRIQDSDSKQNACERIEQMCAQN